MKIMMMMKKRVVRTARKREEGEEDDGAVKMRHRGEGGCRSQDLLKNEDSLSSWQDSEKV